MARITRTQKYAQLRNQLESDRETQLNTDDLSKFEDKLGQLNVDVQTSTTNTEKEELNNSLDDILQQMNAEVGMHLKGSEETKEEVETIKPIKVKEIEQQPIQEPAVESLIQDIISEIEGQKEEVKVEEVKEEKVEEVISKEVQEVKEEPVVTPVILEPEVKEEKVEEQVSSKEAISIEDLMNVDIDDNYLKDTLNEVKAYNKSIGSLTVDEVPKSILNEIRGITEEEDDDLSNTVTLEIKKILSELDDEEVVNVEPETEEVVETTEVEMEKAYEAIPEVKEEVEVQEPLVAEEVIKKVEPIVTDNKTELEDIRRAMETLPKDVSDLLRAYLEGTQEDALNPIEELVQEETKEPIQADIDNTVVVNNIAEVKESEEVLEATDQSDTIESPLMNETMPLQVENTNIYPKEEIEEEKESSSSKIMNTVLIILIIILILVLIVVAYLILVAQNIIPSLF